MDRRSIILGAGAAVLLRIIFTVAECPYRIIARRSAGIARLADLRGKRVSLSTEGSGTIITARAVLSAFRMTEKSVIANYDPAKVSVKEKTQPVSLSQITYSDYSRGGFEERTPEFASDLPMVPNEDSVAIRQVQLGPQISHLLAQFTSQLGGLTIELFLQSHAIGFGQCMIQ